MAEVFFRKVKFWKGGDAPPVFVRTYRGGSMPPAAAPYPLHRLSQNVDNTHFLYVKKNGLYFVVTTKVGPAAGAGRESCRQWWTDTRAGAHVHSSTCLLR